MSDLFLRETEWRKVFRGHVGVADVQKLLSSDLDHVTDILDILKPLARVSRS